MSGSRCVGASKCRGAPGEPPLSLLVLVAAAAFLMLVLLPHMTAATAAAHPPAHDAATQGEPLSGPSEDSAPAVVDETEADAAQAREEQQVEAGQERNLEPGRAEFVAAVDQLYLAKNATAAAALLHQSVMHGYATGYPLLAMLYQYGIGVRQSDAKAVLFTKFGALAGNVDSHLALSYRHQYGIGVARSCSDAAQHAKVAADRAAVTYSADIHPRVAMVKLSDLGLKGSAEEARNNELVRAHEFKADKGAVPSQLILGYAHMLGVRGVKQDGNAALRYFKEAAAKGEAAGHGALGQLYAQGMASANPPIERNLQQALEHFRAGAEAKHPVSLNGLGYMFAKGEGVEQSFAVASQYFEQSAAQGNAEGQYNLGVLYLNGKGVQKNIPKAVELFLSAAAAGSVLAHWQLGQLNMRGVGGQASGCQAALRHFRLVIERAPWNARVVTAMNEFLDGDYTASLLDYLQAAETGLTIGRINAAYLLEHRLGLDGFQFTSGSSSPAEPNVPSGSGEGPDAASSSSTTSSSSSSSSSSIDAREAVLHQLIHRSAQEGDVDAHLKLGDHFYYGVGTAVNLKRAEEHYSIAAGADHPQALFNLGYMREHGIGASGADFHLAKRYYDRSLAVNIGGYYVVRAALVKLNLRLWWRFYSAQPGGLWAALLPSVLGFPMDDVALCFLVALALLLLLLRNHAIAMAQ